MYRSNFEKGVTVSVASETVSGVQGRIARLVVYPVKSCAGIELTQAELTPAGLDLDRAWMVVDAQGQFVTQREMPRLALVQPALKRGEVVLRAPGMLALHLALDGVEEPVRVRVWDDEVGAYDMGDIAAQWFTDFLSLNDQGLPSSTGQPYRLVRFDPEHQRLSSKKWTHEVDAPNQFSDGFPILLMSQASLDELNARLQANGHEAVSLARFRPNIVLERLNAQDEDRVSDIHIQTDEGTVVLRVVKPCVRCPIPNIDPQTGLSSPVVGDTLQSYRQNPRMKGAVTFGMNAVVVSGQAHTLRLGQTVKADYSFE
jgi:uncharacterized protein